MNPFINSLKQSGIRSMTVKCEQLNGVNLGQGVCDIPTPQNIKNAAKRAIDVDCNTYAPYQGVLKLRELILEKLINFNQLSGATIDNVLVTHGATGGFVTALKAVFNAGDEAILFEPFYGYHKQLLELNHIHIKTVLIEVENQFRFDIDELKRVITSKTRAIILCNPSNPSGKVFTHEELKQIGEIASFYGLYIITDEIYEHIVYPPYKHVSIASIAEYTDRVIMLSGFSKTYHITGWRVGYAYGPQDIIHKMGLIHDLLYICPPTPLQYGVIEALNSPNDYYESLTSIFYNKRNFIVDALTDIGFKIKSPQGAYYLIADYSNLNLPKDSHEAADYLLDKTKIATVPAKYFYFNEQASAYKLRFCFAVSDEKIYKAIELLRQHFKT